MAIIPGIFGEDDILYRLDLLLEAMPIENWIADVTKLLSNIRYHFIGNRLSCYRPTKLLRIDSPYRQGGGSQELFYQLVARCEDKQ